MDWETPQWLYKILDDKFHFTLDPCSSDLNHKCEKYYTEKENGLLQNWDNDVTFVNCPYGNDIKNWVKKASESKGVVVMLIPARTDTRYWHDYIFNKASEVWFLKGRIKFETDRIPLNSAPFPSAIIIYNQDQNTKYKAVELKEEK